MPRSEDTEVDGSLACAIGTAMNPREIAALVDMPRLLGSLAVEVNERTRRAVCPLHRGSNRSAFSWREDGRWHCFSCGLGGDRIALVRAIRVCTFASAVGFLATLAGVELGHNRFSPASSERLRRDRRKEELAARLLADAEHDLLLELAAELDSLRKLRRAASKWLAAGEKPELSWEALKLVANALPRTDTAYCIAAFAAGVERAKFALHPELRPAMIHAALERGFIATATGYRFEVPLQ